MKIIVISGPNLNLLGERDESKYGKLTLSDIENMIVKEFPDDQFDFLQSNLEGEIINIIQTSSEKYEGLIINPGGYSHTSVAIRDALELCSIPKIEVHLSNLAQREEFRHTMITAAKCDGYISGLRELGYLGAIDLLKRIKDKSH